MSQVPFANGEGSVGLEPDVMTAPYVSVPMVVVDLTVYDAEPLLVVCGFEVSSVVDRPTQTGPPGALGSSVRVLDLPLNHAAQTI